MDHEPAESAPPGADADDELIAVAAALIMDRQGVGRHAAYRVLHVTGAIHGVPVVRVARDLIRQAWT